MFICNFQWAWPTFQCRKETKQINGLATYFLVTTWHQKRTLWNHYFQHVIFLKILANMSPPLLVFKFNLQNKLCVDSTCNFVVAWSETLVLAEEMKKELGTLTRHHFLLIHFPPCTRFRSLLVISNSTWFMTKAKLDVENYFTPRNLS